MLQLKTLGELRQTSVGGEAKPLRRKPLALLSYIARRAPRPTSRTELATLFWGERGEERARQSLRQALLELKQALGDKVDVDSEAVRLASDAVELDIIAFEKDVEAGRLQTAAERWTGDFFEGSEAIGGEGVRRWIENERIALHHQLGLVMGRLITDAELRGDWAEATAWGNRWATSLPLDEKAHLRLIESLRMAGRSAEALKTHAAFLTRVRTALDLEPSAEFLRLGSSLADEARLELTRRGRPSAAVHAPALAGRGVVLDELLDAWSAATQGTPVVVQMEGEAGSGLTRMCDELVARVGAEALVLRGCGTGATSDYVTASELFDGIRSAEGSAGAAPEALAEVARIVPALKTQFRHLPPAVGDEAALRDGLVQTLVAISEESPVLIVLDDAHDADDATRRLVAWLSPCLTGRMMLLLTVDEAARGSGPTVLAPRGTRGLRQVQLAGLTAADVEMMLGSMVTLELDARRSLAVRLHDESGGLPHDVRELVMSLVDERLLTPATESATWRLSPAIEGRPLPLPATVRERVRVRLDRLSTAGRSLADAMAVLAEPSAVSVAQAVANLTPDEAERALAELLTSRLVRELPAHPGRFQLSTPLLARATAALVPPTKRLTLHTRASEVLTDREPARALEPSAPAPRDERGAHEPPAVATGPRTGGRLTHARFLWLVAAGVAVIALAVIALRRGALPLGWAGARPDVPIIALGRIADHRQDASTGVTKPLTDMLATNLGRVERLRVVSTARMYELVSQNGSQDTSATSLVTAARRAGATELVDGALYARDDGGFRLDLRRVNLASGNIEKTHSVTGATVFELADSGTARLAEDFGATTPVGSIADVTTRSMAAYRLYEEGLRAYYAMDVDHATQLFNAALREDSTFAMAAFYSAISETQSPRATLARFAQAARLATRTSDRERLTILARFAFLASSPSLRAFAETLSVRYPEEVEGYFLNGLSDLVEGDFLSALAPLNRVVSMDSLSLNGGRARCTACDALRQIVSAYLHADSLPAAEREARRWARLQPRSAAPWRELANVLALNNRPAESFEALDREAALDVGVSEGVRALTRAVHHMYAGEYERADRLLQSVLESGAPFPGPGGLALWYRGISYRYQGRLNEALADGKRYRAQVMKTHPARVRVERRALPINAVLEAQTLLEMRQYHRAAAIFDSVSRWVVGDETPSHNAHHRVWAMTHAIGARVAAGDTMGLAELADTVEALGAESGSGRDRRLHHHVRGLLLAARGQDEAAIVEFNKAIYSWLAGYTRTNYMLAQALLRRGRPREAVAALQPALRGWIEASNFYLNRTEIHELLAQAWEGVGGATARDSATAHYTNVVHSWSRADPSFAARVRQARSRLEALAAAR